MICSDGSIFQIYIMSFKRRKRAICKYIYPYFMPAIYIQRPIIFITLLYLRFELVWWYSDPLKTAVLWYPSIRFGRKADIRTCTAMQW